MAQVIPSTIKAIGLTSAQGNLQVIQTPLKNFGTKDLLVCVEAVSVNPIDYKKLDQLRQQEISQENPGILGYDASGVVVKVGSDCKFFKVGDQVMYAGDLTKFGSNSNYQVVDERIVGKKPKKLSHSEASAIPLVSLTAYEGLIEEMGIQDNGKHQNSSKIILVIGGAGGVGSTVIQIAKKVLGLQVVATASREESMKFCKKMGADYVINHKQPLDEQLKQINITSVDYIFSTTDMTNIYYQQFVQLIKPFGHILGIATFEKSLDLQDLLLKRAKISIEFMFTRSLFGVEPEKQNKILNRISELYDKGTLISTVSLQKPFSLENLLDAHNGVRSGQNIGKVVLYDVQNFFGIEKSKKVIQKTCCF